MTEIKEIIDAVGFEDSGCCASSEIRVRKDVRNMCSAGKCNMYGHNWSCPPACGELNIYADRIAATEQCFVVQTVMEMEDDYDVETMMEAEQVQKKRMFETAEKLREAGLDCLVLASGACTICKPCTYPDAPCRFPEKRLVSMESAGLMVNEVCDKANVRYNHGRETITYTGAILI